MNEQEKIEILKLFNQKKFLELEVKINEIIEKEKPTPFLLNLLGISKLQKKNTLKKDSLDALNSFKRAYDLNPDYLDAVFNYALLGLNLNDYEIPFKKLKELSKKNYNVKVELTLSRIYFFKNNLKKAHQLLKNVIDKSEITFANATHFLSIFNYIYPINQKEYLKYCKTINDKFKIDQKSVTKTSEKRKINLKNIKIGFISPDFCDHAIAQFLIGTLEKLKNYDFELHGFNLRSPQSFDEKTDEYKNLFHEWHNLYNLNDLSSSNLIKNKKIDVLIDICGYFARNRFLIMKHRPAPIQILWLGYLNSTGTNHIDYLIADPNLVKDEDSFYSEKILKMPSIWNCHGKIKTNIEINENPFLKNGFFTFGCLNNSSKISLETLEAWSEILLKTSKTKLILKSVNLNSEKGINEFSEFFKKKKISSNRISILKRTESRDEHLKIYNYIDLALDTFPYPGITTSFESVYMGVPFITLSGQNLLTRAGESINKNLGLEKFIAINQTDYVNKAIELSNNPNPLIKLRSNLRDIALNSALFDMTTFGKDFNKLILDLCKKHNQK
jgi:predicted O-linked N-acetylglucosamine transferase (SPINDLY family)